MSFLKNLKSTTRPDVMPSAATIQLRLSEAEQAIPALERQRAALALEAESGKGETAGPLSEAVDALREATERVQNLRAAIALAQEQEAARQAEAIAAATAAQRKSVAAHLSSWEAAATEYAELQAKACEVWRGMMRHGEAAQRACPIGATWPAGTLTNFGAMFLATQDELHRIGGDPSLGNRRSFPGARTNMGNANNPAAVIPLADRVKQERELILAAISGAKP